MLKKRALVALAAVAATGLPISALLNTVPAAASSHREAPLTSQDPTADGTDVYAFTPADDASSVTFVANFNPFQFAAGGPNFYRFGDDVKYQIHLDTNGQGKDGVTLTFAFKTNTNNPETFLYNVGPMSVQAPGTAPVPAAGPQFNHYKNFNRPQVYQVTVDEPGSKPAVSQCKSPATTAAGAFFTPPVNVGPRSVSNYRALANAAIATLNCDNGDGGDTLKFFAGQRSDPFFVDLGGVFDLLGLGAGQNVLTGLNVGSIVVNVPKALLNRNLGPNEVASGNNPQLPIVGVWSSTSRNATTNINANGTRTPADSAGASVQTSRLGMPLVNEAVIQLARKDLFNATKPDGDGALPADVKNRVFTPELAGLFRALNLDPKAPLTNRQDLAAVFLQGLTPLNTKPRNAAIAEELRYNYSDRTGTPASKVNRLGPLGGDSTGFPQGRRLLDDVVDIELLAVQGILCDPAHIGTFGPQFSAQATALGAPQQGQCRPNNVVPGGNGLGDGVNKPDKPVQDVFPYLADPTQG
ncbi:MAG TPA: DUF4331 domain-containing protein [Candidatus Dormibacteraeota bacterium]|nr:DUF4331 domain-containing protein [Candidatus Dormibacteraeota bacterium]